MSSIVLELQQELLKSDCDIPAALRKAHIIAYKLKLEDFDAWINCELNGYTDKKSIPKYRTVIGELKAFNPYNGWIPAMLPEGELKELLCNQPMGESIDELLNLLQVSDSGYIRMQFSFETMNALYEIFAQYTLMKMEFTLFISSHLVDGIIQKVKNQLLDWTLKLEEQGILGENLMFSADEKEKAKELPSSTYIFNGSTTMISSNDGNINVATGNDSKAEINYGQIQNVIEDIKNSLNNENLSEENKNTAEELLLELDEKVKSKKSAVIIKSTLSSLKDFLISVGASLTAAVIQAKMMQ